VVWFISNNMLYKKDFINYTTTHTVLMRFENFIHDPKR
jgi:hypothetical protein